VFSITHLPSAFKKTHSGRCTNDLFLTVNAGERRGDKELLIRITAGDVSKPYFERGPVVKRLVASLAHIATGTKAKGGAPSNPAGHQALPAATVQPAGDVTLQTVKKSLIGAIAARVLL
jgi:hypothetical protein